MGGDNDDNGGGRSSCMRGVPPTQPGGPDSGGISSTTEAGSLGDRWGDTPCPRSGNGSAGGATWACVWPSSTLCWWGASLGPPDSRRLGAGSAAAGPSAAPGDRGTKKCGPSPPGWKYSAILSLISENSGRIRPREISIPPTTFPSTRQKKSALIAPPIISLPKLKKSPLLRAPPSGS